MTIDLDAVVQKNPFVTRRNFNGQVMLNYRNKYYELDEKSDFIWQHADGKSTLQSMLQKMSAELNLPLSDCTSVLVVTYIIFIENELFKIKT